MMPDDRQIRTTVDDPRKLSQLLSRIADLSQSHSVGSVIVGIASAQGDPFFSDFVAFLRSTLRVEDAIFRMTRERAVVHLADVQLDAGEAVFSRLFDDFIEEFPPANVPEFQVHYYEVLPSVDEVATKDVLMQIFPARLLH
jgi:hypothetical protein